MKNPRDTDSHNLSDMLRRLTERIQGDQNNSVGLGFHRTVKVSVALRPRSGFSVHYTVMDALECWPRGYPAHDDL